MKLRDAALVAGHNNCRTNVFDVLLGQFEKKMVASCPIETDCREYFLLNSKPHLFNSQMKDAEKV